MNQPGEVEQTCREPKRRKMEHQVRETVFRMFSKPSAIRDDVELAVKEEIRFMPCTRYTKDTVPLCKEDSSPEQKERFPRLAQKEPEPRHIQEEQEPFQPLEADGTMLTLLTVKSKDVDNRDTDGPASTSSAHRHNKEDCETSQPTSNAQLLSSHCSQSDTEDSDKREQTREGEPGLNKLKTPNVKGRRSPMSIKQFDAKFRREIPPSIQPLICIWCGDSFSYLFRLRQHVATHKGEPICCDQCGKGFSTMSSLKTHKQIHTGEKPYECDQCGKRFKLKCELKSHQLVHTGDKPFCCESCGKSYGTKGYLKIHQRIHTGEKPYHCELCGQSFRTKDHLNVHQRFHRGHRPFNCDHCGKSFTTISNLQEHQIIHKGEKPYECDQCGKSFSRPASLEAHRRVHTGFKPFHCELCGKAFSTKYSLQHHENTHVQ